MMSEIGYGATCIAGPANADHGGSDREKGRQRSKISVHKPTLLPSGRRGNVSFVQLALNKDTGKKVAVKFLELSGDLDARAVMAELLAQRRCRLHPHIMQLQVRAATYEPDGAPRALCVC